EDVHMNIEARLTEKIGEAGKKLHTARSRNDQVATDVRLYLRRRIDELVARIRALQQALVDKAEAYADAAMPGFTHLQVAQPVTFGHHLLAYVEMLDRDAGRFLDARARMNECPLGAAALAGTTFPIDRAFTAKALGFDRPCRNSLDAVASRDFALEIAAAAGIAAVHLSRLAEEMVLWVSPFFRFVELPDRFCTGSSIMPQKKNPDMPELVRGKAGEVVAAFSALAMMLKGLPLAYNKDMQEDKPALFAALDELEDMLAVMAKIVEGMQAHHERMREAAEAGFSTATDLADRLVRAGVPFREAHAIVGKAVAWCEEQGVTLDALPEEVAREIDPRLTPELISGLSVEAALAARNHEGGAAPEQVRRQCAFWRKRLQQCA
ncbi:MAG: argininosuccinate lyase, partial [Zetaproteobacteria bacterium]